MPCFRRQHEKPCALLILFVLASLVAFSFVVYFYAHVHVLASGRIVVHSHAVPHSEKGSNSHSHTNLELQVLDQQSSFKSILVIAGVPLFFVCFSTLTLIHHQYLNFKIVSLLFSRRGPPVSF